LLRRIDALLATGGDVLLFGQRELYHYDRPRQPLYNSACALRRRPSLIIRAFEDLMES